MTRLVIIGFLIIFTEIFSLDYFRLNDIKQGMSGTGYTVFQGENIDSFNVEILAITEDENSSSKMILARVYGDTIEKNGGISEGMSGSPVFINSKYLGAVAYSVNGKDSNLALIRPVEGYDLTPEKPDLKHKNVVPGMAVSVSPVRGDIYIENLGTLSMVEGQKFSVYGHPLSNKGDIYYFLNNAEIDYTVNAKNPFKVGSSKRTIGLVKRDELNGLSGELVEEIATYKFQIKVNDDKKINFEMPKNKKTLTTYLNEVLQKAILKNYPTDEFQAASFECTVYGEGTEKIFQFENFFSDDINAMEILVGHLSEEILQLINNRFNFLDFEKISIDIDSYKENRKIYIYDAFLDKSVYHPGERVSMKLNYLEHQNGFKNRFVQLKLPKNLAVGEFYLEINKGKNKTTAFRNFSEFKEQFGKKAKANEIFIQLSNQDGNVVAKTKLSMPYYVHFEKNIMKKVIIDTYKAP